MNQGPVTPCQRMRTGPRNVGALPAAIIEAVVEGRHDDPFAVLGPHETDGRIVLRAFVPGAERVDAMTRDGELLAHLTRRHAAGFFEGPIAKRAALPTASPRTVTGHGPSTMRTPTDRCWDRSTTGLSAKGRMPSLYDRLGAHPIEHEGDAGVHFAVWAPNARAGFGRRRFQRRGTAAAM